MVASVYNWRLSGQLHPAKQKAVMLQMKAAVAKLLILRRNPKPYCESMFSATTYPTCATSKFRFQNSVSEL